MKKLHIFGAISLLALSLLFTGCGNSEEKEVPAEQQNTQSQQMDNMDHGKINMDTNTSEQSQDMNKMQETMSNSNSNPVQQPTKTSSQNNTEKTSVVKPVQQAPKASSQNNTQKTPAVKVETVSKPATVPQQDSVNTVTTDMSTMDHSQMDHSQMDIDGQQSDNK